MKANKLQLFELKTGASNFIKSTEIHFYCWDDVQHFTAYKKIFVAKNLKVILFFATNI